MSDLTHFNADGQAHMVDVGDKADSHRRAIASGQIAMLPATFALVQSGSHKKGDVLGIARIAGIMAARQGQAVPIGSLTQMAHIRLGRREDGRNPMIKDFAPLAGMDDMAFGGWDPISANALEAARTCGVLQEADLAPISGEMEGVTSMPAVFDQRWVSKLEGIRVKEGANKWDLAQRLVEDIARFKEEENCDRLVMVWTGSTEAYQVESDVHADPDAFEAGMKANDPNISPSQMYAWAALSSGVPFANGAANLAAACARCRGKTRPPWGR